MKMENLEKANSLVEQIKELEADIEDLEKIKFDKNGKINLSYLDCDEFINIPFSRKDIEAVIISKQHLLDNLTEELEIL